MVEQQGRAGAGAADPTAIAEVDLRRMEIELGLARRAGRQAALIAIAIELPAEAVGADVQGRALSAVEALLRAEAPEPAPTIARTAELLYALLPGRELEQARTLAERLVERARQLEIPGLGRELRASLSIGIARSEPAKDWWFATLADVAREGALLARTRGGESVAHTELYALCQRAAERAGPRPKVVLPPEVVAHGAQLAPHTPAAAPQKRPAAPASPRTPAPARAASAPAAIPAAAPAPMQSAPQPAEVAGASELEEVLAAREREHREEVELLERRIAKLLGTIEEHEKELREVMRRQSEGGVPSIYREVQGLSSEDEHYRIKAGLMESILQANLELRECLRSRGEARP